MPEGLGATRFLPFALPAITRTRSAPTFLPPRYPTQTFHHSPIKRVRPRDLRQDTLTTWYATGYADGVDIAHSARKHGVDDEDIRAAVRAEFRTFVTEHGARYWCRPHGPIA